MPTGVMRQISERQAAKVRAFVTSALLLSAILATLGERSRHGWFVVGLVLIGVSSVLLLASLVMVFRAPRSS